MFSKSDVEAYEAKKAQQVLELRKETMVLVGTMVASWFEVVP